MNCKLLFSSPRHCCKVLHGRHDAILEKKLGCYSQDIESMAHTLEWSCRWKVFFVEKLNATDIHIGVAMSFHGKLYSACTIGIFRPSIPQACLEVLPMSTKTCGMAFPCSGLWWEHWFWLKFVQFQIFFGNTQVLEGKFSRFGIVLSHNCWTHFHQIGQHMHSTQVFWPSYLVIIYKRAPTQTSDFPRCVGCSQKNSTQKNCQIFSWKEFTNIIQEGRTSKDRKCGYNFSRQNLSASLSWGGWKSRTHLEPDQLRKWHPGKLSMKNDILGTWQRHRAALWTCSVVMSKWTCTFLLFLEGCLLLWLGWPASRLDIDKGLPRLSPWLESSSCLGELWPDFCLCLGHLSNKTSLATTECKGLSLAGLAGDSESWFGSSCKMMSLVFSSPNHILS